MVACDGYKPPIVRTGYEQVVPHRTGDLFAYSARKPGVITSISDTGIIIKYNDGEEVGIELGRRFGHAAGLIIPHEVVTDLKVGYKFKENEIIAFNSGFFERDYLNPGNVVMKTGVSVKTVLFESSETFEDSSMISKRVAGLLKTKITYIRTIIVGFTDSVSKLIKVGSEVGPEDILCIIEDASTSSSSAFDEATLDTLRLLSAQSPRSKYKGKVEKLVAYYFGDKDEMSDSLKSIANASDRELASKNRSMGKTAFTGKVDESFRVDGDAIPIDSMAIQIYITADVEAGTGD